MKALKLTSALLLTAAVVVSFAVLNKKPALTPVTQEPEHILRPKLLTKSLSPAPTVQVEEPATQDLEKDLADLRHEIERGEFVRQINDPNVSPEIKNELRGRIRRFAQLTLALTKRHIAQLEKRSL